MLGQTVLAQLLTTGLFVVGSFAQGPPGGPLGGPSTSPSQDPGRKLPSPPDGENGECSVVWYSIGQELIKYFITEDGICAPLARQAIRLPFHDCFPDGGCDGSIILTDECTARRDNFQMIPLCGVLYQIFLDYRVGAADLINFAAGERLFPYFSTRKQSMHCTDKS